VSVECKFVTYGDIFSREQALIKMHLDHELLSSPEIDI
jgi:hypothetical protein